MCHITRKHKGKFGVKIISGRTVKRAFQGRYGAGDWVAHNEKMVSGLKKTIAVHE